MAYGSIQQETKAALGYLRQLYEEGVLDENFMLRSMTNIAELVVSGQCGSFFGPWWAPNNPLMEGQTGESGCAVEALSAFHHGGWEDPVL